MKKRILSPEQRVIQNFNWRRWYAKNSSKKIAWQARRRQDVREWLAEYKAQRGCKVCRESDPRCLVFHHRDPSTKEFDLGFATRGYSRERVEAEVAKCDVLCANCHAKLHWQEHHGVWRSW